MTPYQRLGVERDATTEQIKAAFRDKVKAAHPDKGGDRAAFEALQSDYRLLVDPERRQRYDETGETEKPHDTTDIEALQLIAGMLNAIVDSAADIAMVDVRTTVLNGIRNFSTKVDENLAALRASNARALRLARRIKRRSGENVLAKMLTARTKNAAEVIERLEANQKVHARAKEIVTEHDFEDPELFSSTTNNPLFGGVRPTIRFST